MQSKWLLQHFLKDVIDQTRFKSSWKVLGHNAGSVKLVYYQKRIIMFSFFTLVTKKHNFLILFTPKLIWFFPYSLNVHCICFSLAAMVWTHFEVTKERRCFQQTTSEEVWSVVPCTKKLVKLLPAGLISLCFINVRKDAKWNHTETAHCTPACFHTRGWLLQV